MLVVIAMLCFAAAAVVGLIWFARRRRLAAPLAMLVAVVLFAIIGARVVWQPARVEGNAMAPAIRDQDRLVVNLFAYRGRPPRRGEIVMLFYPLNPSKTFVMRIIAEQGDRVQIAGGRVYVNGVALDDGYVAPENRGKQDWGPQVIPEGYYFVMGDNRTKSSDSRHWGYVPIKYITGKVQARWWPDARMF